MKNALFRAIVALGGLLCLGMSVADNRQLTLEDRVKAQEAIERVYYSHQIGATKPLEDVMPREALVKKVRNYLQQTVALDTLWKTPVTAEMLEREAERQVRQSRMPGRLRELHAALGNDSFLIQECLARPAVVDRLTRSFFALDPIIHAAARVRAKQLHRELTTKEVDPSAEHPERRFVELTQHEEASVEGVAKAVPGLPSGREENPEEGGRDTFSVAQFAKSRSKFPSEVGEIGAVTEERDAFTVRVLLQEEPGQVQGAVYSVRKESWDDWWMKHAESLDASSVATVARGSRGLAGTAEGEGPAAGWDLAQRKVGTTAEAGVESKCAAADTWDSDLLDGVPEALSGPAVWTGSVMVIWGSGWVNGSGQRYDPATDTWTAISNAGAPPLFAGGAVWTGAEVIVWGGGKPPEGYSFMTGGRYDPVSDTWRSMSTVGAPTLRSSHSTVWTGSRMVVWGGGQFLDPYLDYYDTGGQYDPTTDTWTPTSTVGAPSARAWHSAVWTGNLMVVWGGKNANGDLNTGGRYDPATDTWSATSLVDAPSGRSIPSAVWTGSVMVVWGGGFNVAENTGGQYDPTADTWSATSISGAPSGRNWHSAVWTGTEMIVWGGYGQVGEEVATGGRYNPATDTWLATSIAGAPSARKRHSAVWTGDRMVVWGGDKSNINLYSGGRYDPPTDTWTPTSVGKGPSERDGHTAVWTGSTMVVWGGRRWEEADYVYLNTGGRYDPATDTWWDTSTIGAPSERSGHTAVWTGSAMVVWGGKSANGDLDSGGLYDPATDLWTPTSTRGAASGRSGHTALWTGGLMVVWGGNNGSGYLDSGGRYDPVTDQWRPTSTGELHPGVPVTRRSGREAGW